MTTITKTATLLAAATILAWSVPADAQRFRGGIVVVPRGGIYAPYFDPFWGPYYPYAVYPYAGRPTADVKVDVEPKQADVYVDGFMAGVAGDFNGIFKSLHTTPGGHTITLHLEGYRTVSQSIYVRPDSTFKLKLNMEKLAPGEVTAPPPAPRARR